MKCFLLETSFLSRRIEYSSPSLSQFIFNYVEYFMCIGDDVYQYSPEGKRIDKSLVRSTTWKTITLAWQMIPLAAMLFVGRNPNYLSNCLISATIKLLGSVYLLALSGKLANRFVYLKWIKREFARKDKERVLSDVSTKGFALKNASQELRLDEDIQKIRKATK